jgi:threonine dehydratase
MMHWPISIEDVYAAERRIRPHLTETPLRHYAPLDEVVAHGIHVAVKHENHQPTNAFKVRNTVNAVAALSDGERARGVIAASRGNHGAGLAWAGRRLGARVVVCVPRGNSSDKNDAMRGFGAEVVESGDDYDSAIEVAARLQKQRNLTLIHSTNDKQVLAGAATVTLEMLRQDTELQALVVAVGGGSQAVGALTVAKAVAPTLRVYAVQSERAPAMHDAVKTGRPCAGQSAETFADGIATRGVYEMTWETLREGLSGFVTVSEAELAEAVRTVISKTHNLVEGAGAAGLAGLMKLRHELAGKRVGIILSGGNLDLPTLRAILNEQIK